MSEDMRDRYLEEAHYGEALWKRSMYGEWLAESDEERELRQLAEEYHVLCDAYDRGVCSGISPRTGEAMPVTQIEMRMINKHAREVRKDIMRKTCFTEEQVSEAIRKYCK